MEGIAYGLIANVCDSYVSIGEHIPVSPSPPSCRRLFEGSRVFEIAHRFLYVFIFIIYVAIVAPRAPDQFEKISHPPLGYAYGRFD